MIVCRCILFEGLVNKGSCCLFMMGLRSWAEALVVKVGMISDSALTVPVKSRPSEGERGDGVAGAEN